MVKSPCVKICKLDEENGVCIGCGRTIEEITNWSTFSDLKKNFLTKSKNKKLLAQQKTLSNRMDYS
jgi:predicted Fe-S protein YdhL (DUF1289 family)